MSNRTKKQREQFEYFSLLGNLSGLQRWIYSKRHSFAKSADIPHGVRDRLLHALDEACIQLKEAEKETRELKTNAIQPPL